MRLADLKVALIEKFFQERTGVETALLRELLNKHFGPVEHALVEMFDGQGQFKSPSESQEPSKALNKFTDGKRAILTIMEEENFKVYALFVATRVGRDIYYADLTEGKYEPVKGSFAKVKGALNQAKQLSDDVYFSITAAE